MDLVQIGHEPIILAKNVPALRRISALRGELTALAEGPGPIPCRFIDHAVDELTTALDILYTPESADREVRRTTGAAPIAIVAALTLILTLVTTPLF